MTNYFMKMIIFYIIAGLGAFIKGYIIIATKEHYLSMNDLYGENRDRFIILKNHAKQLIKNIYGDTICFEHGASNFIGSSGGCHEHAHFHIIPSKADIIDRINKDFIFNKINFEKKFPDQSYLLYENIDGEIYIANVKNVISQYFRHIIAQENGIAEKWNYDEHPYHDNMLLTINSIRNKLSVIKL